MTEFPVKGWTKNSINRLLVKVRMFGTVDRRPGSSRRHSAHTDENVDTVESLLLSHEDKPQSHRTVKRNFTWGRGRSINHQFRGLFTKICVSSAARKGTLNSWLKQIACTCYFRYAVWEMTDKINKVANIYRYFSGLAFWAECFVPNVILSPAPVEKPPALYLILHFRSGMSTNGPNCENPLERIHFQLQGFWPHYM